MNDFGIESNKILKYNVNDELLIWKFNNYIKIVNNVLLLLKYDLNKNW